MIFEIAKLCVKPGSEAEFVQAAEKAIPYFKSAKGCESFDLSRCMETPNEFMLRVGWATLENHTVDFRESEDFQKWRGLVGEFFDKPPEVIHIETVLDGF